MADKKTVYFVVNGSSFQITTSSAIYTTKATADIIGAKDKATGNVVTQSEVVKRTLVQLAATVTEGKKTGNLRFYCDPSQVEKALAELPGKKIGGKEIQKAYRPLRRCYV